MTVVTRPRRRLTREERRAVGAVVAAVVLTVAAALVLLPLRDDIGAGTVALVLLLPPLVAAYAGLRAALVCAVAGAMVFNLLFTEPYYSPRIGSDEAVAAFVVYLVVAAALAVTVSALRARSREAERRARTLEMLEGLGEGLLRGPRLDPALRSALHELVRLVPLAGASLHVPGDEDLRISAGDADRAERALARTDTGAGEEPRVRSLRYEGRVRILPVVAGEGSIGLLAADPGDGEPAEEAWAVVEGFADLAGLGAARARLDGERTRRMAAESAERLRARVVQAVSHDLRTPLAAIRAAAGAIRTTEDVETRAMLLDDVERQSGRLAALVSDMLDLSRIESGALVVDRQPTPVDGLVEEAVDSVAGAWDRVEVDVDATLPPVRVDDTLMRQALANLVENALMHAGGPVTVTAAARDGALEIRVVDHGPGIPEPERRHVFEPYRRLRTGEDRGTGLGLAIVRGYVEAHEGAVRIETTPGGGATMVVTVPVT